MAKLDLRLRNLETGEAVNAMFESEVDAFTWLRDRPKFTQVLGVATHGLPEAVYKMLRAAVRPLDDDETQLAKRIEAANELEARKLAAEEHARELEEVEAERREMRNADPHRPIAIRWTHDGGVERANPVEEREITGAVREAVIAWVQERQEWVKDRGQVIGEAHVSVWPGPIPTGQGKERVLPGGQFFPMAAE